MSAKPTTEAGRGARPQTFFKLNGTYLVAPETTGIDAVNDIGCLMESLKASIKIVIEGASEGGCVAEQIAEDLPRMLYGVLYQLEMVENLVIASHGRK